LAAARDRIELDVVEISEALRGLLLDPKNEQEKRRKQTAETDLSQNIEFTQAFFPGEPGLAGAVNSLKDFTLNSSGGVQTLDRKVLEMAESDPVAAVSYYNREYRPIREQREQLFRELTNQVERVKHHEAEQAWTVSVTGLVSIVLILFASLWVARYQAASVTAPLNRLVQTLDKMRQGDFSQRAAPGGMDDLGAISAGLNRLSDELADLVHQVQRSGAQVNTNASQIAESSRAQQATAREIASTTAQMGVASREISTTSRQLANTINEVNQVAEETARLANSGQTEIARMESTMHQLMHACGSISSRLSVLNEKTANINSVVSTITKVADQTNLLSLNAAIEAEKAGEYGLGFAVVAIEIRRLADQTAVATYDIEKMVKEMQSAVLAGVSGMDKFSVEVRRGVDEISQVSSRLSQIIDQVKSLSPRFQTVNAGMSAQADGAAQISETLAQLSDAAQHTTDLINKSNQAIEQLSGAARGLQISVSKFKL
jgi:methyl-accepting chemotaxis protein WspA